MKEEALKQRDEIVSCLLEELVKVRQNLAESEDVIRNLKTKIEELEEDKKTLRETTPDNSVAHLQDELIASKLREAEASLSLKDLKQRVQELNIQWQRHLQVSIRARVDFFPHTINSTSSIIIYCLFFIISICCLFFFVASSSWCRNRKRTLHKIQIQHRKNYSFGTRRKRPQPPNINGSKRI